jgi:hypothetical protein
LITGSHDEAEVNRVFGQVFGHILVRNNPDDTTQPHVFGNSSPDTLYIITNVEERHPKDLRVIWQRFSSGGGFDASHNFD